MGLNLRPYQADTLTALRNGFAAGRRTQILYAPTGAGKTEMAIALLDATRDKNNNSAMILDRIILCDQTSQRLEKYSIPHGVLQAGHWRFRPYENIQICSAQTLEKRGDFPDLKLLVVDECHTTRQQTVEFIKNNPDVKVIGLTATPFTKGLGKIYDGVISTITTRELVDQKVLVPLRVFIAKEIDMTGAKKVAGEWSQQEATTRGMKITGDIVAEWVKKTHEIFGKPRKTIVFCSGVNHGSDLSRKFAEAGYNFVSISYKDDDQFKADVITDFSKPDTEINGLIATDILTKGFDVSDVMIGISARPFSKSLSSHIQQMGRVMRGMPNAPDEKPYAVWLDHSGNYLRFQQDWDDVYNNGVHELDEGREKPKKEKTDKEKKESCCPKCSHVWQSYSDVCLSCGYERPRRNQVEAVAGELHELKSSNKLDNKQDYWSMCQYKVQYNGWNEKRALAAYKNKFGVWPNGLHKQVSPPSKQFERDAKASLIRYLKGKGK